MGPAHDLLVQVAKAGQRVDDSGEITSSNSSKVLDLVADGGSLLVGLLPRGLGTNDAH